MNHTGTNPPSNPKIKAVAIIPARYESVRLPGKVLLEIAGEPMICWVVERALAARNVDRAIVATDDQRIATAVTSAGYEAVMTRVDHKSGTDRIAEVAASLADADIIVNVQGDEPLISPLTIERAVEAIAAEGNLGKGEAGKGNEERVTEGVGIVTTWEPMETAADVLNPDVVKIVVDDRERAIYFSRSPVPYPRDAVSRHGSIEAAIFAEPALLTSFRKHTGLYVYRREVLLEFAQWPQPALELLESLEQLRALEHGVNIKAIEASAPSIGVDTSEDLERVRRLVSSFKFQVSSSVAQS
ncbi:MAG TPA: 3-deoxy-manno-octulosonate cytidylyltransferase [Pyrinomonadaceae bacterium]|nr:3-deoxy-manno-octulosonate cytidylyltransferase [Pyrinomonadaceae bacterium]